MQDAIYVAPSEVGQGVYANRVFKANELVGLVTGHYVTDEDYSSEYCIGLDDELGLEPVAPFRFLNHSCEPNCELYIEEATCETTGKITYSVTVETLREISPHEQLVIDYGWPADHAIECRCGAESCRGWIVDPAELHLLREAPKAAV